jgi:hypothetical protein
MADSHVISALSKKRGELLGSIRHYKQLIQSLDKDLVTIDATIKIFEPDFKFGTTKIVNTHKRNRYFETGEARRLILETLKEKNEPIRTDDLSDIIMNKKSLNFDNDYDLKNFRKSVVSALSTLEKDNLVERVDKIGLVIIWKIKELI